MGRSVIHWDCRTPKYRMRVVRCGKLYRRCAERIDLDKVYEFLAEEDELDDAEED